MRNLKALNNAFDPSDADLFNKIISIIESGYGIGKALISVNVEPHSFYKNITKEQRGLISIAKTQNTKYGSRWRVDKK